jgi:hypothetical protein
VGGGGGARGAKRPRHAAGSRKPPQKSGHPKAGAGAGAAAGDGERRSDNFPPKQKKKIDKPKHLKRKIAQAQAQDQDESAAAAVLALTQEQEQLEQKKADAKEKFYQLCRTLVGEDKWDDEKQAIYDNLVKEKGACIDLVIFIVSFGCLC